ncbi:MAG: enoyl-CoA hydratase/isomerase family protein [Myxococcales bacterium]|nr:enoyl-CoA hydratase/isomerase family protein [Myxococcales bacterium]
MQYVTIERRGRISIVRFDRGDGVNGLSQQLMRELTEAARSFESDTETSAIVLTGGEQVFTLGYDLKDPEAGAARHAGMAERRKALQYGPRMCDAWEALEPMTFAAIEGWCVGGGAALAVSLDMRVMAEDATLYVPEIERGMNMSWGSVPRFVNLLGPARTKRVVVMAEKIEAQRAEGWGLCDEVAPRGGALERALSLAERVAQLPPVQVRMCKQGVDMAAKALNRAVSYMDGDQFALSQSGADYEEGIKSFLQKRPPKYTGR